MDGIDFEKIRQAPLLTSHEAAQVLRVSERTLYSLTQPRGTIPKVLVGMRLVRYSPQALQEWIQNHLSPPGSVA